MIIGRSEATLADALGRIGMRIDRTLPDLRDAGLIVWRSRCLTILDEAGLRRLAQVLPAHLHFGVQEDRGRHLAP